MPDPTPYRRPYVAEFRWITARALECKARHEMARLGEYLFPTAAAESASAPWAELLRRAVARLT